MRPDDAVQTPQSRCTRRATRDKRRSSARRGRARATLCAADLVVEMPAACLHAKDFLNHRYRLKRALYLLELRRLLDDSPLVDSARSAAAAAAALAAAPA